MTIAGLYAFAVAHGIEHLPIMINYDCSDDYYGLHEPLEKDNIDADNEAVYFKFC